MTRKQAEENIIRLMEQIRHTYYQYNPTGDNLTIIMGRNYLSANNSFQYGGADYDRPLYVTLTEVER